MNRDADNRADARWIAQCARCLREQWPHADPTSLEEAAAEIWRNEERRKLTPTQAALGWLRQGLPESALVSKPGDLV